MIANELQQSKKDISKFLNDFFRIRTSDYSHFHLDKEIFSRLLEFTLRGKMYRGGILIYINNVLVNNSIDTKTVIQVASALELLESGVLIQDDVMDQDLERRGLPSIHAQFSSLPLSVKSGLVKRFGESVATCAGNIAYFLSFEILNQINLPPEIKNNLIHLYAKEMVLLNFSQVQDIYLTDITTDITTKDTLDLYIGKTARYTWILPIKAALFLTKTEDDGSHFEKLGLTAGILYQLIDDRLGLFGIEKTIGKPVGSDIREGKKTLYYTYAKKYLRGQDLKNFNLLYGKNDINLDEIEQIKELVKISGAYTKIEELIIKYSNNIDSEIKQLNLSKFQKDQIKELVNFIHKRNK